IISHGYPNSFRKFSYFSVFILFYAVALRSELKMGNANIFSVGLLVVFLYLYHFRRLNAYLPGLILAVAVSFKLYALIIVPFLLYRREFGIILSFVVWFVLLNFFVTALFHHSPSYAVNENILWFSTLTDASADLLKSRYNVSVMGFMVNLGVKRGAALYSIWSVFIAAFLYIQYKMRHMGFTYTVSITMLGILFLTPVTWSYWVVFSFPALIFSVFSVDKAAGISRTQAVLILLVYISFVSTDNDGTFVARIPTIGLAALSYFFYTVAKKAKEKDNGDV
ncbi:MAG: DUF2029 domain-containing protein, partial [Oligoflexia bacterium]|nr:DUF2029 domain-containing protein [Oligoflexia bacterium]